MTENIVDTNKEQDQPAKKTKFQSPVPIIIQIRNLVFGKKKPDIYTRLTYYVNLIVWITFIIWHSVGYVALNSKSLFLREKGIPVQKIIETRGQSLGFMPGEFASKIETFNALSAILWGIFFIGLVLLYRKKKLFIYFTLVPIGLYLMLNTFYLSFAYFFQDTTNYDKVALLVVIVSCLIHYYMLKNESSGGTISFFGESDDLEEAD